MLRLKGYAWSIVKKASNIEYDPPPRRPRSKVIYVVALAIACLVNTVNMLSTLGALKGKSIFTPLGKWSPLSFMKLTHEASSYPTLRLSACCGMMQRQRHALGCFSMVYLCVDCTDWDLMKR